MPLRVLITGASRGIGRALAKRLLTAGAQIAACATAPSPAMAQLIDAAAHPASLIPLYGDLADPEVPARLVEVAVTALGGLDAVVSNAGISDPAPLAELSPAAWDRLFAVNSRAPWQLAQAVYPALKASRGSFVAVASTSGSHPHPGMGAYSSSKAALIMTCRVLAQEWAADGVRVNSVSPGLVRTSLTEPLYRNAKLKAAREALVPLGRIANAETDIAGVVRFLIGADAAYITGQNIEVDGGLMNALQGLVPGRPTSK